MTRPTIKRRHTDLQLESVARISSFPIVESGIYIAGNVYEKIKSLNSLMNWGLDTAEQSLAMATATAMPAIIALNMPIATIDHLLCRGIDIVEQRVPVLHLPPHLMYWNTREYVNNKFVKPVLTRADSVKMIGSQAANAAVERLAGAINVADQYVDRYLPADPADKIAECKKPITETCTDSTDGAADESSNKAVRTIEHGARFSRKLQRRLTRRTLAEARALKEQGTECIHVLLYVVELLATDPKLALQKAKELWVSLSGPEPENQARPTNLEQLLVLFTRETARRIVHLVNGTTNLAARSPRRLARALLRISHHLLAISEQALKVTTESIYRLLTDVLVITSGSLSHRHQQQQQLQQPHRLTALSLPKRKLFFQTSNGTCSTPGCTAGAAAKAAAAAAAAAAAGGNGSGGSYLSLIAKINIVPLARVAAKLSSSPSSFIEELRSGDNDDDDDDDDGRPEIGIETKVLDVSSNGASEFGNLHSIMHDDVFDNAKDSHPMLRPVFVKSKKPVMKSSLAYNSDSVLPMKINKYGEKRTPVFAKIKPMSAIRQKQ